MNIIGPVPDQKISLSLCQDIYNIVSEDMYSVREYPTEPHCWLSRSAAGLNDTF
jgi:hypothetical protein